MPREYPHPFTPDPLRFAEDIASFAQSDNNAMPAAGSILCTGSSSMLGWHPRISQDLPGLSIIPRGFGGSQMSDVIFYLDSLILKYSPRAVLIYEGDNDVNAGKSAERVLSDLVFLVDNCRLVLPDLRFYVISLTPSIARKSIWPEAQRANAMLEAYSAATVGIEFIDVASCMLTESGDPRSDIYRADKLHLNGTGYDLWATAIAHILLKHELPHEAVP